MVFFLQESTLFFAKSSDMIRSQMRKIIMLALLVFLATCVKFCCAAESVFSGDDVYSCYSNAEESTTAAFKNNLFSLLSTLEEKGPDNYGFYEAVAGISSDKVYGLVQCRGDLSADDCASCLKYLVKWAPMICNNSNNVAVWLNWCFLRYSDGNFAGQWNNSLTGLISDVSSTDDPNVAVKGLEFMSLLTHDVPNQPYLYKTGSVDVGNEEKRYGLAQCNRDLSKSSCNYCIEAMLDFYFQVIGNENSYTVISYGCRMWYDKYKFYFDNTVPSITPENAPNSTDSSTQLRLSFTAAIIVLLLVLVSS